MPLNDLQYWEPPRWPLFVVFLFIIAMAIGALFQ